MARARARTFPGSRVSTWKAGSSPTSSSPSGSPLEQINDGFAGMAKGAVLRAVLTLT